MFIPDSGSRFVSIPDPGSRGQKGTGSRIRIRGSGMFLPDPDFFHTGSGSNNKKRGGGGKIMVSPFLVVINFTKLKIIKFFE
jgi:hypothetical protein